MTDGIPARSAFPDAVCDVLAEQGIDDAVPDPDRR